MFNTNNQIEVRFRTSFLYRVYGWMTAGLAMTAAVATFFGTNHKVMQNLIIGNPGVFYAALFGQLILVWGITLGIERLSYSTALAGFIAYALLSGFTLSVIFIAHNTQAIATAALVTAGTFGAMALYGYSTKRDLSGLGNYIFMALIGLIIANVVNIFMRNSAFDLMISCFGVLLFTALTAYDVQRLKALAYSLFDSEESMKKATLLGALTLYLDVINLFLYLLNILGRRRD